MKLTTINFVAVVTAIVVSVASFVLGDAMKVVTDEIIQVVACLCIWP